MPSTSPEEAGFLMAWQRGGAGGEDVTVLWRRWRRGCRGPCIIHAHNVIIIAKYSEEESRHLRPLLLSSAGLTGIFIVGSGGGRAAAGTGDCAGAPLYRRRTKGEREMKAGIKE